MKSLLALMLAATMLAAGPALAAEAHTISMSDGAYAPKAVKAKRGDTLRFVNDDTEKHAVYSPSEFGFNLGNVEIGNAVDYKVRKAGTYDVYCVLHAKMKTTVRVTE